MDISALPSMCAAEVLAYPQLFGAQFLSLETNLVESVTQYVPGIAYFNNPGVQVQNASFCNVTLTHTHPGQNDTVTVQAWLPLNSWNGRMQAIGGGGWAAGLSSFTMAPMMGAMGEGYLAITTDGGHSSSASVADWVLLSAGNIDLYALQNLGHVSLNDMSIIGKSLAESFYGKRPNYSY